MNLKIKEIWLKELKRNEDTEPPTLTTKLILISFGVIIVMISALLLYLMTFMAMIGPIISNIGSRAFEEAPEFIALGFALFVMTYLIKEYITGE